MLKLRHLRLRAITKDATFAADLPFGGGLNVLRAGNTSGKSTCLQAIMFALGLERSLGPQLTIPLPYAMREMIQAHKNGPYQTVLQSFVELEIENDREEVLSIRRDVSGGANPKLVRTWSGPRLTEPESHSPQRDFFVHDPGASQHEDGFHHHLARFLGWDLPDVTKFDGSDCPLYLETIFPMIFVEQKRGWSAIQGPFPTFLGIQDLVRRVMEFLLDLDAGSIRRERAEVRRDISLLEQKWSQKVAELQDSAGTASRFRGVPTAPTAEFAAAAAIELEIFEQGEWKAVSNVTQNVQETIVGLEKQDVPTTETAAPEIEAELKTNKERAAELIALLETAQHDFNSQSAEKKEIERRITSLETDLARNQDALKLEKFGSDLGVSLSDHRCPTCHQEVSSELLPSTVSIAMATDENILFLKSQIDLYGSTQESLEASVERTRANYHAMNSDLRECQRRIRELREALVQPSSSPSRARIEEIVHLQAKRDRLATLQQRVDEVADELLAIARNWVSLKVRLRELASVEFSQEDKEKIEDFSETVRQHVERYGFVSYHANEVHLSPDNFRPIVKARDKDDPSLFVEKELNFEISASDGIRLKWAYYLALLSLARRKRTNHPGLVIFDEPGQHQIEPQSITALLQWSADNVTHNQQTIIATSENLAAVQEAIKGTQASLINFDDFILKPLS